MKIATKNIVLLLFIVLASLSCYAQPSEPCDPIEFPGCDQVETAPIDDNLVLLGLVAVSFGLYTIYKPIKKASN